MSNDILDELEKLVQESANKRQSFLIAITKSSRAISEGANKWFCSEGELLQKEMKILEKVMPEEVSYWNMQLRSVSTRFQRALTYLNRIIDQAEKGRIISIGEVHPPPKPEISVLLPKTSEEKEEKELNLVSAILEVFDSATDLEKLIKDVEKESKRTIYTAKLVIKVIQNK